MRFFKTLLTIIIAISLINCSDKTSSSNELDIDKKELLLTIDKFNKAFQEGNVVELESMITDSYVHTNGNSKSIGKKDWVKYLHKRKKEIQLGKLEVTEYKIADIEIEFYGNTAIVTAKIGVSSKRNDEVQKNEYRITNIWINDTGNWKRAGFHDGKIK